MWRLFITRFLLPGTLLTACAYGGWWIYANRPQPQVMEIPPSLVRVEGQTLRMTSYPVIAYSQGEIQPQRRTQLTAEVSGKLISLSPNFRPGAHFEENEVLLRIDPRDYEIAVTMAKATVAQRQADLIDEQARAEQAIEGWRALGKKEDPGPMVSRAHQIARAQAELEAARAQLTRAELDLQRTEIRAPYSGQTLSQNADLGQVISSGGSLGEIYATDALEVRLPLPERELRYLRLSQHLPGQTTGTSQPVPVRLHPTDSSDGIWEGHLTRVEGAVDSNTRQIIGVAHIPTPTTAQSNPELSLKIGQFVTAELEGGTLEQVFVIPRSAVRAGNEIILITEKNTLQRKAVTPLAGDAKHLVISATTESGPREGDVLCTTPIPFPINGARVLPTIDGLLERPGMAGADGAPKPSRPTGKGGPS